MTANELHQSTLAYIRFRQSGESICGRLKEIVHQSALFHTYRVLQQSNENRVGKSVEIITVQNGKTGLYSGIVQKESDHQMLIAWDLPGKVFARTMTMSFACRFSARWKTNKGSWQNASVSEMSVSSLTIQGSQPFPEAEMLELELELSTDAGGAGRVKALARIVSAGKQGGSGYAAELMWAKFYEDSESIIQQWVDEQLDK